MELLGLSVRVSIPNDQSPGDGRMVFVPEGQHDSSPAIYRRVGHP
jgi:hypothetical protein